MKRYDYSERQQLNERSRNEAKHYMEPWSADEVELLESEWTTKEEDLVALANLLGRTVEACRQKHYDLKKNRATVTAKTSLQAADKWTKGFTSLEDMGY